MRNCVRKMLTHWDRRPMITRTLMTFYKLSLWLWNSKITCEETIIIKINDKKTRTHTHTHTQWIDANQTEHLDREIWLLANMCVCVYSCVVVSKWKIEPSESDCWCIAFLFEFDSFFFSLGTLIFRKIGWRTSTSSC